MKVCVIQPYYSKYAKDMDRCYKDMLSITDQCDESMDIIVLPEACDVPAAAADNRDYVRARDKFNADLPEKLRALALRCKALVFANFLDKTPAGYRNTIFAFSTEGEILCKYPKAHPAPGEEKRELAGEKLIDCSYSNNYSEPLVFEYEGLRYAFLTCYDFYMYELFPVLARQRPDIIIGCSHQRTDSQDFLASSCKFLCYNTNAYLIRSSVSMGEDSPVGGCSMVVSPKGEMLVNMGSKIGLETYEIDPSIKYFKSAGFLGKEKAHWEYIEDGRRPFLYLPGGSMMVADDVRMPYPRICAHRGFPAAMPENTLPAYGAAVAMGADEIEFDLWTSKDGVLVSCHDRRLDRTSDGTGRISDYTYEELLKFDFGSKADERFAGLKICTFEDILKKLACMTIMNIHVKIWGHQEYDPQYRKISDLIHKYACEKHCYIMSGSDENLAEFRKAAPDIRICMGAGGRPWEIVDRAIAIGAEKVQLFKPYFNQSMIDKAHEHGIICNVFESDEPDEACSFIDMGVDTILTNNFIAVSQAVKKHLSL